MTTSFDHNSQLVRPARRAAANQARAPRNHRCVLFLRYCLYVDVSYSRSLERALSEARRSHFPAACVESDVPAAKYPPMTSPMDCARQRQLPPSIRPLACPDHSRNLHTNRSTGETCAVLDFQTSSPAVRRVLLIRPCPAKQLQSPEDRTNIPSDYDDSRSSRPQPSTPSPKITTMYDGGGNSSNSSRSHARGQRRRQQRGRRGPYLPCCFPTITMMIWHNHDRYDAAAASTTMATTAGGLCATPSTEIGSSASTSAFRWRLPSSLHSRQDVAQARALLFSVSFVANTPFHRQL